jgi:REP element-mobilizing transposase RayT
MARLPRVNIEGALYYITSRGDRGEKIFIDDKDYIYYLTLLKNSKTQLKFKLFSYVLLPDHFHLLLELFKHNTISQIMFSLNSSYTKHFNSRHHRQGRLFQERYKMTVAEKSSYLLPITAYIHTNPKALKLVKENKDYPYSSIHDYLKSGRPGVIEDNAPDISKDIGNITSYQQYMSNISQQEMEILAQELAKKPVLGSKEFIAKVKTYSKAATLVNSAAKPAKHWRIIVLAASAGIIIALILVYFYMYTKSQNRERQLKSSFEKKEVETSQHLEKQYQVQIDEYYKDLAKKLQQEKQKSKALQEQLLKEH